MNPERDLAQQRDIDARVHFKQVVAVLRREHGNDLSELFAELKSSTLSVLSAAAGHAVHIELTSAKLYRSESYPSSRRMALILHDPDRVVVCEEKFGN